jgi:hypothetical protein
VQLWCRSPYASELLDWNQTDGSRLTPGMRSLLLDATDPVFIGGRMQFFAGLYEDVRALPTTRQPGTWPRNEHDPWLLEAPKNTSKPDNGMGTDTVLPQAPATLARLEGGSRRSSCSRSARGTEHPPQVIAPARVQSQPAARLHPARLLVPCSPSPRPATEVDDPVATRPGSAVAGLLHDPSLAAIATAPS